MVSVPNVKEEQWTLVLQFYLDSNGLPYLDKASVNEVYYEDAPVKTPTSTTTEVKQETTDNQQEKKEEEKKAEKVKKERSTVCIIKVVESTFGLTQNVLDQIAQKEANQENEDRLLQMAINKRNEIENFIYSTRTKLESDLAPFVTSQEKEALLNLMQAMEDWLYSGDEEVYVKSILEEKGKNLSDLGTKIYKRYHDWEKLYESLGKLEQCINLNVNKVNEEFSKLKSGTPTILNQSDLDELTNTVSHYNTMLNEGKNQAGTYPKIADPPLKWEDVNKASEELVRV